MKSILKIGVVIAVSLSTIHSLAQQKQPETMTVRIDGNFSMCKATVEEASTIRKDSNTVVPPSPNTLSPLNPVFENYFLVKDALVATDASTAAQKAKELAAAIEAVAMDDLLPVVHTTWMNVRDDLATHTNTIATSADMMEQRDAFAALAVPFHELASVSEHDTPVYYQYCPMYDRGKGAYWLSRERAIKNPYYGSQMLTCGTVEETIATH